MTGCAIGRELLTCVVGIGCLVIIANMTSCAGIGRIVVIAVVAFGAIVCNGGMRPFQRVIIVVNGEACRLPGVRGMAGGTIGWNIE